jgi:hypothetical protein
LTFSIRGWTGLAPVRRLAVVVIGAVAIGCSDRLEGGAACPLLCPEQNIEVLDTIIEPVVLDSVINGYPARGSEPFVLVAHEGSALDARSILRYDTLPQRFRRGGVDSAIYAVSDAQLLLFVDTTGTRITGPVTLVAYDVDTTAADDDTDALLALFRPDRELGAVDLLPGTLPDTLHLPLANDRVLAKLTGEAPHRLRVGLRLRGSAAGHLRLFSENAGAAIKLSYDASPDTAVAEFVVSPQSFLPAEFPSIAHELSDFTIVAEGVPFPSTSVLQVGGLPSRRVFLRFDPPKWLTDSATVIRATLLLTQLPSRVPAAGANDSLIMFPQIVRANRGVADIQRLSDILGAPNTDVSAVKFVPGDSGVVEIDIVNVVRNWRVLRDLDVEPSIVLRSSLEGVSPYALLFFSRDADPSLRPRLRISYVNRIGFGRP